MSQTKKPKVEPCSIVYIPMDAVTKISYFLKYGKEINDFFQALIIFKKAGAFERDYVFAQNKQFRLIEWSSDILGRLKRKTERQYLAYKIILDSKPLKGVLERNEEM